MTTFSHIILLIFSLLLGVYDIKALQRFQYIDDKDQDHGLSIRERSKLIVDLVSDNDRLKDERKNAARVYFRCFYKFFFIALILSFLLFFIPQMSFKFILSRITITYFIRVELNILKPLVLKELETMPVKIIIKRYLICFVQDQTTTECRFPPTLLSPPPLPPLSFIHLLIF